MKVSVDKFKWTDKPELSREHVLIAAILAVFGIGYFKLKPYFETNSTVITQNLRVESHSIPKSILERFGVVHKNGKDIHGAGSASFSNSRGGAGAGRRSVVERTLFDGTEVTLTGILQGGISSLAPENPAVVSIHALVPDQTTSGFDVSEVYGALAKGSVSENRTKKRINISFSELTNSEGRSFQVTGYAIDPETRTMGVPADYASGLGSRLLGAVLDRVITGGDQVGMSALMNGVSNNNSATSAQLQMASVATNQQASAELSDEATKDLRGTQAELSLPAGTEVTFKIKALSTGGAR
jgi:hypothetical protein